MLWIALVVGAVLFLAGVAIHHVRVQKIQYDCLQSLENLRRIHEGFMAECERKYKKKLDDAEQQQKERIDAFFNVIADLENKIKVEQQQSLKQRQNYNQECEKLNRERATLEQQVTELVQENQLIDSAIKRVKDAIEAE